MSYWVYNEPRAASAGVWRALVRKVGNARVWIIALARWRKP
jgi:hypothetical protein